MWSEAKDLTLLTAVEAEGSRDWGSDRQIHVMINVHDALLYPRHNNLPFQLY